MKSRSTFYSTGIPTTFNDLGECDEIDRGGVPCAVPFCGYGTADFGLIPDRMKEDGNQIVVYQPDEVMRLEVRLEKFCWGLSPSRSVGRTIYGNDEDGDKNATDRSYRVAAGVCVG